MKIEEILEAFKYYNGALPKEAIEEARKHKKAITPKLLEMLDYTVDNLDDVLCEDDSFFGYTFAMFLLAEWKETKAFPYLIKLLDTDSETVDYIFGDDYPDYVPRLLASTYNGDDEALFSLIENSDLDEFIRSSVLDVYKILYLENVKNREFLIDYLTKLINQRKKGDTSYLYSEIVEIAGGLKLVELDEIVDKLFDAVEEDAIQELKDNFRNPNYEINRYVFPFVGFCDYIDDSIEIMENWQCFNYAEDEEFENSYEYKMYLSIVAKRNKVFNKKRVGRNDPCPCGSGKKYKKCCIDKNEENDRLNLLDRFIAHAEWLMSRDESKKARKLYRIAWFTVQDICNENGIKSVDEFESKFDKYDSLTNWFQDYLFSLEGSDKKPDVYERLELCDSFEKTFDLDDENEIYWKETILRSRANAEFTLEHVEEATKIIEDYLKEKPNWTWGYVEMADWYLIPANKKYYNLDKAKEILLRAEKIENLEDIDAIYERLADIFKLEGNNEMFEIYNNKC